MPAQIVNLTDTFDEWRIKTNTIATLAFTSLQNVIDDTAPQLGGDLVLNSNDITGTGNINFTGILTSTSIAGTVVGTTQSAGTNSTLLATTAFVHSVVASEDTLAEDNDVTISGLANLDLLQYDSGTSRWVNTAIGAVVGTTQSAGTNSTLLATTAFVHSVVQSEDTIAEMNDTTISSSANLDLLQYNSSTSKWVNIAIGAVVGATQSASNNSTLLATTAYVDAQVATENTIAEMDDVTLSSLANDNILQYNSGTSRWENQVSAAGVSEDDATALAIALGG
jgi:hypothetical protein